jgi:hypothetical protein
MSRFAVTLCCAIASAASTTAFAAPGTAQDVRAIKASLQSRLKDADSAKIRGVQVAADGTTCGMLNAKNSYGAYNGFEPFLAVKLSGGKFYFIGSGDTAAHMCADKGMIPKF